MLHLRCVLVGDPCVGKTSLIVSYTRNGFCERYCPTAFDNYSVTVCVDGNPLRLELCDTAGRSEFDTIRPLSYADASVFLLCFNVSKLSSLSSATQRWLPEIRALAPTAPILLVGTQSDRRLCAQRGEAVEPGVMSQLAARLQLNWLECSAVTQQNLKEVFDLAILHALCHQRRLAQQPTAAGLLLAAEKAALMTGSIGYPIEVLKAQMLMDYKEYMCVEKCFPADKEFLKFTNNMDYTMPEELAKQKGVDQQVLDTLTAFSHWTYQATDGNMMVVDLQGIISSGPNGKPLIELTDPAIHCTDWTRSRFGDANRHEEGMKAFFHGHKCNQICQKLGLKVPEE